MVPDSRSGEMPSTQPYTLNKEIASAEYDELGVRGHIEVSYDDAGKHIVFEAMDMLIGSESELPDEAERSIDEVFTTPNLGQNA